MCPLLPPPPASAEAPRESSSGTQGLPDGYQDQFEIVLQILKDRPTRFDKPRRSPDQSRPNTTPPDEISDGHSHLTTEGMRDDKYKQSQDAVEDELDVMKHRNPYAYWVILTYFDVDSGHGDYDLLAQKAENNPETKKTFDTLQMALYILVSRLLDQQLYCRFPAKVDTRTNRQRTTEEIHAEIRRVYDAWCKDLKEKHPKKYKTLARDNTALQCNRSTRTVQRALKFHANEGEAA